MGTRVVDGRWGRVALVSAALLVGSLVPSPLERRPEWRWTGPDKLLHLVGHAGYAVTLADAFAAGRSTDREAVVLAVCVSTAHSLLTGRLQERVPGRAFEVADVLGAVAAGVGWYVLNGSPEANRSPEEDR